MDIQDDLKCGICLDIANKAIETVCCHNIFCEVCLVGHGLSNCPMCRTEDVKHTQNFVIRRIIGKITKKCSFCDEEVQRNNWEDHEDTCEERPRPCIFQNCDFRAKKSKLLLHMTDEHAHELTSKNYMLISTDIYLEKVKDRRDLIKTTTNSSGNTARLGSTGKYYCGEDLGFYCPCCTGCGPTNGCNCLSCFKLDLETRKMPLGFFLNRSGYPIRKGGIQRSLGWDGSNTFYCGRKVMDPNTHTDGWCGPTDGNNCPDCQLVQEQLETGCYQECYIAQSPAIGL